jgi:hypothetical protein
MFVHDDIMLTNRIGRARTARARAIVGKGVEVMRTYIWIALVAVVGGLALWGWWYQHRRDWSTYKHDEAMRRHINRNYD